MVWAAAAAVCKPQTGLNSTLAFCIECGQSCYATAAVAAWQYDRILPASRLREPAVSRRRELEDLLRAASNCTDAKRIVNEPPALQCCRWPFLAPCRK